jgi:hypothetical protein
MVISSVPRLPLATLLLVLALCFSSCVRSCVARRPNDQTLSRGQFTPHRQQHWLQRLLPSRQKQAPVPRFVLSSPETEAEAEDDLKESEMDNDDDDDGKADEYSNQDDHVYRKRRDNQVYQDRQRDDSSSNIASPLSSLAGAAQSLLNDPTRLGRWSATGLQLGLIVYLVHAIWKAAREVVDEYSQELSGADPCYVKRDEVTRALEFFEQDPQSAAASLQANEQGKKLPKNALPPLAVLQIAQKLAASGLPLRSSESTSGGSAPPSVESVLLGLTRSEASLLHQCFWSPEPSRVNADALRSSWNSIAGLESAKERLLSSIATVKGRHSQVYAPLFDNSNTAAGVLLYGPPGCGKTMLVKALASTARLPCLVLTPSVLLRKYVGETNQQVRSLFSLANKLAPCVLCIDELDGLFRERNENEHEVSRDLKTEFLQWWDGMLSGSQQQGDKRILVIGATNRPFDVDSAVLRRLPQSQFIGLPDLNARLMLLKQLLRHVPTDAKIDVHQIASMSENYSPSDLRQLLQTAALSGPLKEASYSKGTRSPPRPLTTEDVLQAFQQVPPTPMSAQYRAALSNFVGSASSPSSPNMGSSHQPETTNWGNFYNVGTIQVDTDSFDEFTDMVDDMDEVSDELDDEEVSDEDMD